MKIDIQNLEVQYDGRTVLAIPELAFEEGHIYAIVGPNGSGKSTLLKAVNLLISPHRGRILYDGAEPGDEDERVAVRRRMSLLHQTPYLFSESVFHNIAYGLKLRKQGKETIREKVREALRQAELEHLVDRPAQHLSGGEHQRIALARALALDTEVLLLDEPTANVDRAHTEQIEKIILSQKHDHGRTVLIATHTLPQAHRLADEVFFVVEGEITALTPENFFTTEIRIHEGRKYLHLSPSLRVPIDTAREGTVQVSLNPDKLDIFSGPAEPGETGTIPGTLTKAIMEKDHVRLTVEGELEVTLNVTRKRYSGLGVNLGSTVAVIIPEKAIKIH